MQSSSVSHIDLNLSRPSGRSGVYRISQGVGGPMGTRNNTQNQYMNSEMYANDNIQFQFDGINENDHGLVVGASTSQMTQPAEYIISQ
jgi:hypothetical protein